MDLISVHTDGSLDELKAVAAAIDKPLTVNMDEAGRASLLSLEELQSLGLRLANSPGTVRYSVA